MSDVTIHHNPKCGTSRNTLAMLERAGIKPNVVLYLETPLNLAQLRGLVADLGVPVRDLMRQKEALYKDKDMGGAHWTDDELLMQMAQHPILLNRPVVRTPLGTKLCRPSELVLALLSPEQQALVGSFTKEDGEQVQAKQ